MGGRGNGGVAVVVSIAWAPRAVDHTVQTAAMSSAMTPLDRYHRALAARASTEPNEVAAAHDDALAAMVAHRPARRLAALLFDRLRMLQAKPQKFGTQRGADGALWPIDPFTTDSERAKWDLPSRAELERAPLAD